MQGHTSPFMNAILPKMRFNRHFPRAVVTGPTCYQGKGLDEYELKQYTSHLARFVGYFQMEDKMGNLLRIQMDQHQMIIGTQDHFLSQ